MKTKIKQLKVKKSISREEQLNEIAEKYVAGTISAAYIAVKIKNQADRDKFLTIIDQRIKATARQIMETLKEAFTEGEG